MNERPVVYLVDDDASHLRATGRLLRLSGFEVRTFSGAAEFLAMTEPDTAGCVITDLRMPVIDGLTLQQKLNERGSTLPVIVLTGYGDIPTTVRAMRGGAEDYLTKAAPMHELVDAVNRAFERNRMQREARARTAALERRMDALTPREREVLEHVVRGERNKQIAAALGIRERTVKYHRTAITSKLGVSSAAELALIWAQLHGSAPNG